MNAFLVINRLLRVRGLKFRLQSRVPGGLREAVGAAARFGGVVGVVFELGDAWGAPGWMLDLGSVRFGGGEGVY